jgi:hypothetical protein
LESVGKRSTHQLNERPVRRRARSLPASSTEHGHPTLCGMYGYLVRQPCLADTRFADHQKEAATAAASVLQTGIQFGQFALTADKCAVPWITDRSLLRTVCLLRIKIAQGTSLAQGQSEGKFAISWAGPFALLLLALSGVGVASGDCSPEAPTDPLRNLADSDH